MTQPTRPTPPAAERQSATPQHGVLLFSHGSRDPLWRQPMEAVQTRIQSDRPDLLVGSAYLELCTPDLPTATEQLVRQGAQRITIVPMFLGTGRHAREDLPQLVTELRRTYAHVDFDVQQAIGEDPRMTALMAQIASEPSVSPQSPHSLR